jgi:thiamine-phosphate pyrophosphorylase
MTKKKYIYLISPNFITYRELEEFNFFKKLEKLLSTGYIKYFQLRMKNKAGVRASDAEIIKVLEKIKTLSIPKDVKVILNDNIALSGLVEGLHIGEFDGQVSDAKRAIGKKILGVSCYNSIERASLALKDGADYVALGGFFPTTSKQVAYRANISLIDEFRQIHPNINPRANLVVIGGINRENISVFKTLPVNHIAILSAIWFSKNEQETLKELYSLVN